jgi:hypothetical protein
MDPSMALRWPGRRAAFALGWALAAAVVAVAVAVAGRLLLLLLLDAA